ncbi:hypothetical protein BBP40_001289 [Aspergillus hancockii]|nr:hypothetical protein BBP40_001289 [Aspergillus hancockii]
MAIPLKSLKISLRAPFKSSPCQAPNAPVKTLPATEPAEEEWTAYYNSTSFDPVYLYETFHSGYQIAAQLDRGSTTRSGCPVTRWRWCPARYIAVKVKARFITGKDAERDLRMTEHISRVNLKDFSRDSGPYGSHICMAFGLLCETLAVLKGRSTGHIIPLHILKPFLKQIVEGLRYLHFTCDLVPHRCSQKHLDDRTMYQSRTEFGTGVRDLGRAVIADFGLAVDANRLHQHLVPKDDYRAPEVILCAPWVAPSTSET